MNTMCEELESRRCIIYNVMYIIDDNDNDDADSDNEDDNDYHNNDSNNNKNNNNNMDSSISFKSLNIVALIYRFFRTCHKTIQHCIYKYMSIYNMLFNTISKRLLFMIVL